MRFLKDPHQVAEQMKRREFNRHRRGAVGCLNCTGPPSYRRARFCPSPTSPSGSPADVYFLEGAAPFDGSFFKLKEGGDICYHIDYSDATTTSPGTIYLVTDVGDYSDSCDDCDYCAVPTGFLVQINPTPTKCCKAFFDDRLGVYYNGQVHDTSAICGVVNFVPLTNGVFANPLMYQLRDETVGVDIDYGGVFTGIGPPDCTVLTNTFNCSLLYSISTDTSGNFTNLTIAADSVGTGASTTTLVNCTVPTAGVNNPSFVPIVDTSCPTDASDTSWLIDGSVSVRPVCTLITDLAYGGDCDNSAQDVTFTFTAAGGSEDWYALWVAPFAYPTTAEPYSFARFASPTTGNGTSSVVVHFDANASGADRQITFQINNAVCVWTQLA